jgi:Xaa-Pro aminopeptidase
MRINQLKKALSDNQLDAFIITKATNIYYYTGSISGGLLLIPVDEKPILYTSALNYNIAVDQAKGIDIETSSPSEFMDKIVGVCLDLNNIKIGFDELSLSVFKALSEKINSELIPSIDLIWSMRRIKDKDELANIKKAAEQACAGMKNAYNAMRVGIKENELAAEASYAMMRKGADNYAFPFNVASGPRSAYPHAGVTNRKIMEGEFVTIDMGARYRGYCIDLTRTFIIGKPTKKQREIYSTVLDANCVSFSHFRDGNLCVDVDKVSRDIIEKAGYGKFYVHGLGHGIGLEVHEPPSISKNSKDKLVSGNIVSNEPGIYLHGYGGVRIEDSVQVTDEYPITLTKFPKKIEEIIIT